MLVKFCSPSLNRLQLAVFFLMYHCDILNRKNDFLKHMVLFYYNFSLFNNNTVMFLQ